MEKLELFEFAGQRYDVVITKPTNGQIFVTFKSENGYGYPTLEIEKIKSLIKKCDMMNES